MKCDGCSEERPGEAVREWRHLHKSTYGGHLNNIVYNIEYYWQFCEQFCVQFCNSITVNSNSITVNNIEQLFTQFCTI